MIIKRVFDLVCRDCKTGLWVGESLPDGSERHLYTDEGPTSVALCDLLFAHARHRLEFGEAEALQAAEVYEEVDIITQRQNWDRPDFPKANR